MPSIRSLHQQLVSKARSATELAQESLQRLETLEPKLHSFLAVTADQALAQAARVDAQIAAGESIGLLAGIPIGVKDNICTQGIPTTCGSRILEGFKPPYDATVVSQLAAAGAVLLGKTNLDEFGMGSSTENSGFYPTANPWNLEYVPGGSSGGSAAAVAAGQCVAAIGSDTGGSIRQPAAFCGVVGIKPTYGLVSRYGLVAYASSLDQIGTIAASVEDAAIVLQVLAGHDPKDSTSLPVAIPDYTQFLIPDIKGMKIGLIEETLGEGLVDAVGSAIDAAAAHLESLGATVQRVSCPRFDYALPAYYIIAPSEASANLARYDGVKYGYRREDSENILEMYTQTRSQGFGAEVKRRIMIGTYTLSAGYYDAYYLKAQKVRTLVKQDFENALQEVDVLMCPTAPTTAYKTGDKMGDPLSMYLGDLMTVPLNLAGLPGISVPCGFSEAGLPIGLQLIGRALREDQILRVAYAYEQSTPWHQRSPAL